MEKEIVKKKTFFSNFYKNITKENMQVYTIVINNHLIINA